MSPCTVGVFGDRKHDSALEGNPRRERDSEAARRLPATSPGLLL